MSEKKISTDQWSVLRYIVEKETESKGQPEASTQFEDLS